MSFGRILVAVGIIGAAVGAAGRWAAARRSQNRRIARESDRVDEAGVESFPASDPPSWTLGGEREA